MDQIPSQSLSSCYDSLIGIARYYLFVREQGVNRGRWVDLFNRAINENIGNAWCAAFICHCLLQNDEMFGFVSKLNLSDGVLDFYRNNKPSQVAVGKSGFLFCLIGPDGIHGHMEMLTSDVISGKATAISGNTNGSVGIEREGQGVFEKSIDFNALGAFKLLGFLDPYRA